MGFLGTLFSRRVIPPPSGAYAIGTMRFEVTEPEWLDPSAPSPTARKPGVQAWYPAERSTSPTEPYLDDALRAALAALMHVPKFLLPQNPSFSVPNAPAVPGRYPVIIFNHGLGSFQKQSTSLLEELASHGYVVLSIGHPFESLIVQYADGTTVQHRAELPAWRETSAGLAQLEKNAGEVAPLLARARAATTTDALREAMLAVAAHPTYAVLAPMLATWRRDTTVVLDRLAQLPAPLRDLVDVGRVGVFGHSLGGMVSGQLAMTDRRVRAGLSYDGAQLPCGDEPYRLLAPFCFVTADATRLGKVTAIAEGMNDALALSGPAGSCAATVIGAGHLNFTDMNNLAMARRALGKIDRVEMARALRALTVGFFDHHLRGKPLTGFDEGPTLRVRWAQGAAS
jgi:predicted dienelactone hydrolase